MLSEIFINSAEDVPDPSELNSEKKNPTVFDYLKNKTHMFIVLCQRKTCINVDCFYLAQSHFKVPCQTIIAIVNFICLVTQDLKNLNHIFEDRVGSDMTKEDSDNYPWQLGKITRVRNH